MSAAMGAKITQLLRDQPIMPTRHGLKKPAEAYHPAVNLFGAIVRITMRITLIRLHRGP